MDARTQEFVEYVQHDAEWAAVFERPGAVKHHLAAADHTFSGAASRADLGRLTLDWLSLLENPTANRDLDEASFERRS